MQNTTGGGRYPREVVRCTARRMPAERGRSGFQRAEGGAKVRGRIVPELLDERMAIERALHDAALHPAAPAVHEPQLSQADGVRGPDVLVHHRWNIPRREGVQVELGLDWNLVRLVVAGAHFRATI